MEINPQIRLRPPAKSALTDAVASARTCYSPEIITSAEVTGEQLHRIGKQCFDSGHHTVFLHKMFTFDITASRHAFHMLHYQPFYNTSQSSQRYVVLKKPEVIIPPDITGDARSLFCSIAKEMWGIYEDLIEKLTPIVKENYPGKRKLDSRAAEKLAIETARYVLPIGAKSTAIHSVQLMTLLRLYKLAGGGGWGWELKSLTEQAMNIVKKQEPDFDQYIPLPIPEESNPEQNFVPNNGLGLLAKNEARRNVLRERLKQKTSLLIDWSHHSSDSLNLASSLTSGEAITDYRQALDPMTNSHLVDSLHTDWQAPYSRILSQSWVSFLKRISHSANAQDQRHRTINSVTSLPQLAETATPDYITPTLINYDYELSKVYDRAMQRLYETKLELLKAYEVPVLSAMYLTPNSHALYVQQSGSLLAFRHKWILRSCWRAQREIWGITMEELGQINGRWPELKPYLGPPCYVRYLPDVSQNSLERQGSKGRNWIRPKCTEGRLYCDIPVIWKRFTTDMERLI